jgi:catechol 2,3-dioxygenase-like lactoylglutathione lyase family enzyme
MNIKENVTGVQHVGIPTNDLEATVAFYNVLGFETVYRTADTGTQVAFLRLHDLTIETYQNGEAAMKNGAIDHIALNVRDVQAAFEFARSKGLKLLDEAVCFLPFFKNGVRFFTVEGPNREKVEFNQIL